MFSHTYFPFFMIIICYVLYGMIGNVLFRGDAEKTALFLIVLSVFHIWNFTSTHTLSAMFLLRIWQGKAIVAGFILPLLMYLFYQIFMSEKQSMKWAAPLYAFKFCGSSFIGNGNYYGTSYDGIVRTFRWYLPPESETYALYMDRSTAVCCLYDLLYGGDLKRKENGYGSRFLFNTGQF